MKMYVAISTGVNPNYGKANEKRYYSNFHTKCAIKEGWIRNPRYAGSGIFQIKIIS